MATLFITVYAMMWTFIYVVHIQYDPYATLAKAYYIAVPYCTSYKVSISDSVVRCALSLDT